MLSTLTKKRGSREFPVQVNDVVTSPIAAIVSNRDRYKYRFLRVTRQPTIDRPDSGRILVENEVTGKRTEHYAILFNLGFQ